MLFFSCYKISLYVCVGGLTTNQQSTIKQTHHTHKHKISQGMYALAYAYYPPIQNTPTKFFLHGHPGYFCLCKQKLQKGYANYER